MKSARELRREHSLDADQRALILEDYNDASKRLTDILYTIIVENVSRQRYIFKVFDYINLLRDRLPNTRMKPSTLFTGFWDPTMRAHRKGILEQCGLPLMLEQLQATFHPLGYMLEDISDPRKSKLRVLRVSVPEG